MMIHRGLWNPVTLAGLLMVFLWGGGTCTTARAQEIAFSGGDVVRLARAVAKDGETTSQLYHAYKLRMTNGHAMVLTAANVFELLTRATVNWQQAKVFPETVPLVIDDLRGPLTDPHLEPKTVGLIAFLSMDIGRFAPNWLIGAEAPGHAIWRQIKIGPTNQITAAQFLMATAVLIDETQKRGMVPDALAVPQVRSPRAWDDTRDPHDLTGEDVVVPRVEELKLRVWINGFEFTEGGPIGADGALPVLRGPCRLDLAGNDLVVRVKLLVDNIEHKVFDGPGPHSFEVQTAQLDDGAHTLTITAFDPKEKQTLYIISLHTNNARRSPLNPLEIPKKDPPVLEVNVEPLPNDVPKDPPQAQ